jgi:hypothetical protein
MLAFLSSSMLMLKFNRAVPLSWNTRHHLRSNEAAGFNIIFQKSINLIRLPFLRVKSHLCCEGDEWVEINKGFFFLAESASNLNKTLKCAFKCIFVSKLVRIPTQQCWSDLI